MHDISYERINWICNIKIVSRYHKFLMEHCDHCIENTTMCVLFKRIYYVSVLYRRDQICLVKFLFTSSREYFILLHSFFCNISPLFSLRSFLRMDVGGSSRNFCSFQYLCYSLSFSLSLSFFLLQSFLTHLQLRI